VGTEHRGVQILTIGNVIVEPLALSRNLHGQRAACGTGVASPERGLQPAYTPAYLTCGGANSMCAAICQHTRSGTREPTGCGRRREGCTHRGL
jgi:hypothetical protein